MLAVLGLLGAAAATADVGSRAGRETAKQSVRHRSKRTASAGVVFGGVTSEGSPVAIQVSPDGREVAQMAMAMGLKCQPSGASIMVPAIYKHVPVRASGAFRDSLEESAEGSGGDASIKGTVSGRFNRSMTSVTTTWTLTLVVHDATGTDTCDSGTVNFTALQ